VAGFFTSTADRSNVTVPKEVITSNGAEQNYMIEMVDKDVLVI
jgi:hypothetical protein